MTYTAKHLLGEVKAQVLRNKVFDAIQGAEQIGPHTLRILPFDGPPILLTVATLTAEKEA